MCVDLEPVQLSIHILCVKYLKNTYKFYRLSYPAMLRDPCFFHILCVWWCLRALDCQMNEIKYYNSILIQVDFTKSCFFLMILLNMLLSDTVVTFKCRCP